ncbi:rod shape-determining protein [Patescibacteria group bacterium]|nr:rod shape-determining protein [Patescibacteria group bacterium]
MNKIRRLLGRIFAALSTDIGIDLGTANTLVYQRNKGVVLNEPTMVALNTKTGQLVAVGKSAKNMLGRTPAHIKVVRPLVDGVISDFEMTEELLAYVIGKIRNDSRSIIGPRVLIGVPSGITNVEMRAARDAAKNAGAREVLLVEEPMAAAIGAKLPVHMPVGNMIIDIGGGTTDIAIISLNGIVVSRNLRIAGDTLDDNVTSYIRDHFKVLIGDRTAEDLKILLASIMRLDTAKETVVRGRDVVTGLPREVMITDADVREAISHSIDSIIEAVRDVLERTPPEILADVMQRGIFLSGGGALIPGVAQLLEEALQVTVHIVPDPLTSVVRGTGIILENLERFNEVLIDNENEFSAAF